MFQSTRLKLTAWYLFIVMFISLIFSVVLYTAVDRELGRFEHYQNLRTQRLRDEFGELSIRPLSAAVDQEIVTEARKRLITNLIILNLCILAGSSVVGYFLAGRTLTPIRKMLDEQARFIGDASHELKTPLTSLRAEIEVYLRSKKQTLVEANSILESNLEEVIRLQNLSDSLMAFISFEKTDAQDLPMEDIKLKTLIDNASRKVNPMAKGKNIEIVNRTTGVTLYGDSRSLLELFVILLDNAIKYSEKNKKIIVTSNVSEGMARIKVSDNGFGMDDEEMKNAFNRFYRADKSRSGGTPGYGLGLSIAKEIVKLHNGNISVESNKSKGSVFIVELPV